MRIIFVNQLHPATGLIGSVRHWRFAQELSARGHQTLLICELPANSSEMAIAPEELSTRLETHDWHLPFILATRGGADDQRHRGTRSHGVTSRLSTAAAILLRGGTFWRWRKSVEPYFPTIKERFAPDIALATFGNLDTVELARRLAAFTNARYVPDVKDPVNRFVPNVFRRLVRQRWRSAAGMLVNAEWQGEQNATVGLPYGRVIYSGAEQIDAMRDGEALAREIILVGSIRDGESLLGLLRGVYEFQQTSADKGEFQLAYAGQNDVLVRQTAGQVPGLNVAILGQMPRDKFLSRCAHATAMIYVGSDATFHHKAFELFGVNRPVIAFPLEHAETIRVAAQCGAWFRIAQTSQEMAEELAQAAAVGILPLNPKLDTLSWRSRAAELEGALTSILKCSR